MSQARETRGDDHLVEPLFAGLEWRGDEVAEEHDVAEALPPARRRGLRALVTALFARLRRQSRDAGRSGDASP